MLGRQIRPVAVDGRSEWPTFAAEAERLITRDHVRAIFGCYTSASRRTIVPIIGPVCRDIQDEFAIPSQRREH